MAKEIIKDIKAREALGKGVDILAGVVRITLGPKGRNVLLEKKYGSPVVTNDGVTIAREIEVEEPEENVGVQVAKEIATKTNDLVGDGTTTALVLAQAMLREGLKSVAFGHNPVFFRRGMEEALRRTLEKIKSYSLAVEDKKAISQVASISANDPVVGEIVAQALEKVGKDGVVTVEESKSSETTIEVTEGMQFDQGYLSSYFVTNSERMEVILEEPLLLICDFKIANVVSLLPLLQKVFEMDRPLLIIAEDIEQEVLATLAVNKLQGVLKVAVVKAPAFGDRRKEILGDLAVLTGGQVISQDIGMKLEKVTPDLLGEADKVRITKDSTTIIGGRGNKKDIEARERQIRAQIEKTTSTYDREKLQERLAKLQGGVAIIWVGASSEVELKEKKYRVEDAISAAKAAIEEGVVPGGGALFVHVAQELDFSDLREEERQGAEALRKALEAPAYWIAENAGYDGSLVVEEIKKSSWRVGFEAQKGEFVDLVEEGVIDPTKVLRVALSNAESIVSLILVSEALIFEAPEEKI
ncbi:MAG TPA: chaperonin GroEL [Candidatus Atribacteria bacterium]|nr:chaperonin GroEL [Candidatus Atribacteria bacterium]